MVGAMVLVVDDDSAVGTVLTALLEQAGYQARHAPDARRALDLVAELPVELVISDLRMPGLDGMKLLAELKRRWPDLPVILLTAHGTVPLAVEAMKSGAADFILKPFDREEVLYAVRRALAACPDAPPAAAPSDVLVGDSPAMREVYQRLRLAARGTATVLLRGESGTGKGLAARALHEESPRRSGPFVVIHCAALPETLLESELFGYEKGAFTGATTRKPGRVELGDGGTLFLDEIGDVPLAVQAKLLRVVQERTFERLGGGKTVRVDVRFVAATHRPLESMVEAGQFREDLFYRLNVVPLWLPPLRERPEDIEALARHFCAEYGTTSGRPDMTLEADAIALLRAQSWPGNVRQLQNLIERLTVLATRSSIGVTDVEHELGAGRRSSALSSSTMPSAGDPASLDARRRDAEREALVEALRRADDNRTVAARILGISRRTLYYKLKEHALA